MYKLGKKRAPSLVVLFTILSCGIYGIVWFYIVLEDLRRYKETGMPGWVFLVSLGVSIFLFFLMFPFAIFMIVLSFLIPASIDNEREKLGLRKKKLTLLGLLPTATPIIFYAALFFLMFTFMQPTSGLWLSGIALGLLIMFLNLIWVYFIQKNLNELWKIASRSFEFAEPVFDGQTEKFYGDEYDPNRYAPAPYDSYIENSIVENEDTNIVLSDEDFIPLEDETDENLQNRD